MVLTGHNGEYAISGLTKTELAVIFGIISTVDSRCFEVRDTDGCWPSGEDFILSLTDEERKALTKIGEEIKLLY